MERGAERERPAQAAVSRQAAAPEPLYQRGKAPKPLRPEDSLALPGMEDADRERGVAAGEAEGQRLSEELRRPLGDISRKAGAMERESPLFFGSEASGQGSLFQRAKDDPETRRQNPWFLKSERVIGEKMKGPMPGDALVRMLENNGVKPEELQWSGLNDLKGKPRVTPDEVREHLAANAIKVEEVAKGGTTADQRRLAYLRSNIDELAEKLKDSPTFRKLMRETDPKEEERIVRESPESERYDLQRYLLREREASQLADRGVSPVAGATKFSNYQLPGGEHYREMLLTLPVRDGKGVAAHKNLELRLEEIRDQLQELADDPERVLPDWPHTDRWDRLQEEFKSTEKSLREFNRTRDFVHSHWDEPNVLAHVRFNDRTGANGERLLHLEELQSDWHQKGRDQGYQEQKPWTPEMLKPYQEEMAERFGRVNPTAQDAIRFFGLDEKGPAPRGVPDAPFKKTWPELLLKRMVRYAAENGYDGISWTPGDAQAERYDLAKHVDRIGYTKHADGTITLVAEQNGQEVFDQEHIAPERLADYIGKDLARKIIDETPGVYSRYKGDVTGEVKGLDLKVGGEGMKGFYDKMVPDMANKIGKPFGARVGETEIGETDPKQPNAKMNVPYLPITDAMRTQAVEQGFPLFQRAATEEESPVSKTVGELVDDLKGMPRPARGTMLNRVASWTGDTVAESLGRSKAALETVPGRFEKAWAWSKATTAALWHDYLHPLEQTDWKRVVGQKQLAEAETALRLQDLGKALKDAAPKAADRVAMTHWMEANGDMRKLREWQMGAKTRALQAMTGEGVDAARRRYLRDAQEGYDRALTLTPEQKALAQRLRQHFDDMLEIAKDNGLLDYGYRNYVMHLYEKADAANLLHLVDNSELNPDPSLIKRRFYATFYDAEGGGLTPKSKDIGYLLTAYDKSMNEAIASRTMMRSLLDAKAPDGRPIAAIKIRGGWVIAREGQEPQVLRQRARPKSLDGYRDFDRPQLRNFLFEPTTEDLEGYDPKLFDEDPARLAFRGDLMIHPKYASQVEDMLTPSWFERNETLPQKAGRAVLHGSALAKELMTVVAPFHMVQEGVHGMEHKVNPFKLPKIDLTDRTQRLLASHGLTLTNYDAEGLFGTKALAGVLEAVPGVNKAMDTVASFSRWQFEDYIPKLKMKMAVDAFERNTKRYGKTLSEEQIAELSAKESNAAFGNLNTLFDTVPRTKTFKSLLRLATFAPDFLESRIRFVGQAMTRYGGEQRAALIRGALAMYVAARVGNALLNHGDAKWDPEHALSLVVNGKAYSLRTVQGDLVHAVTDPRGFAYNRLNPLTTRPIVEFLSGRDQFGRQKSGASQVKDLVKSTAPFGIQKVIDTPDESLLNSILTSAGINAKNDRTPVEETVHKLYLKNIPDQPDDEEKQAESRKLRAMEDGIRSGHMTPAEVWDKVDKGEITPREAGRTVERGQQSRLAIEFKGLSLKDAIKVYTDVRQEAQHETIWPHAALDLAELRPLMERKAALLEELPEGEREATAEQLKRLLAENEPQ